MVDSGSVYYDVTTFPAYGKLSGNTLDNLREGHRRPRADPAKRHPADFALWKTAGRDPRAEVAEPVGRRLPRLAHRVLGHVHEAPRRALRHPHRRQRQQVPAPRGRDRAIRRGRGASGRVDLGARRAPPMAGQKMSKSAKNMVRVTRPCETRASIRSRIGWLTLRDPLPERDGLHWEALEDVQRRRRRASATDGRRGRRPRPSSSDAANGYDARFREAVADRPRSARCARRDLNEAGLLHRLPDGEKYALLAVVGLTSSAWISNVRRRAPGSPRTRCGRSWPNATPPERRRTSPQADELRDRLDAMGLEVMDTPEGTKVRPHDRR